MVTLAPKRYEQPWRPPAGIPPQLILESNEEAPAAARAFAREVVEYTLDDPDPDHLYNVALVVSELVTNSVRYGTEHPRGSMLVVLDADDARTRIEVHDTVRQRPQIKPEDVESRRGRGLHIVDALATWGTETRPGQGKYVWAEVPGR
ncbi:ATP-binding protein [Streptomyces roseifaciens]